MMKSLRSRLADAACSAQTNGFPKCLPDDFLQASRHVLSRMPGIDIAHLNGPAFALGACKTVERNNIPPEGQQIAAHRRIFGIVIFHIALSSREPPLPVLLV